MCAPLRETNALALLASNARCPDIRSAGPVGLTMQRCPREIHRKSIKSTVLGLEDFRADAVIGKYFE